MTGEDGFGLVSMAIVCTCVVISTVATQHTGHTDLAQEVCSELPEIGACRAAIPQWFYNDTTGVCEEFIYGGCPGSRNRFPNRADCIRHCRPEVCEYEPDVGPCRANIRAWYYDGTNRACKEFSWGGCEGNENKFHGRPECETACAGTNQPCEFASDFENVGKKAVHANFRESEWFVHGCGSRCEKACLADHPWGSCVAYSVRKRWWKGCNCYLYDRYVSSHEFDPDTEGITANRICVEGTKIGKKGKKKGKGRGKNGNGKGNGNGKKEETRNLEKFNEIDLRDFI